MNIYANTGDQVRFINKNGLQSDLEKAQEYLQPGEIYTVDRVYIGNWSSKVYLMEVPGVSFNTVCFEDVGTIAEEA